MQRKKSRKTAGKKRAAGRSAKGKKTKAKKTKKKASGKPAGVKRKQASKKAPKKKASKARAGTKAARKATAAKKRRPKATGARAKPRKTVSPRASAKKKSTKPPSRVRRKPAPPRTARGKAAPSAKRRPSSARKPEVKQKAAPKQQTRISKPRPRPSPRYSFTGDIPQAYDETYFRAMPRDPESIFVYWELSSASQEELKSAIGEQQFESSKRLLRVVDVTGIDYDGTNALDSFDIDLAASANNWYVKVPQPGRTYVVECGRMTEDGVFHLMVRSNPVALPRGAVSPAAAKQQSSADTDALIRASGAGNAPPGASETFLSSASLHAGEGGRNS